MKNRYPLCAICGFRHYDGDDGFEWMDCWNHLISKKWEIEKLASILKSLINWKSIAKLTMTNKNLIFMH